MNHIISLILDNWYLVLILFFLFSGVFNKMKTPGQNETQQEKRQNRRPMKTGGMPPFAGNGQWPSPLPPERRSPARSNGTSPAPAPSSPQERGQAPSMESKNEKPVAAASRMERLAEQRLNTTPAREPRESRDKRIRPSRTGETRTENVFKNLHPDDALRGLIWSEILGPPRSKRPFHRK